MKRYHLSYQLTEREIELIAQFKSSKEISEILFISRHTVDTHRRNILEKTGMKRAFKITYTQEINYMRVPSGKNIKL